MDFNKNKLERLRQRYPKGAEVELGGMRDEPQMQGGLRGVVEFVDDAGQIHCTWENGSTLALIPGVDSFRTIAQAQQETEPEIEMEMKGP